MQPLEPKDAVYLSIGEKIYYMLFTAYYFVDIFFLWTNNHDHLILCVHHATTLSLIFISGYIRTTVIGICVMLLHDIVDVPLYLGKVCTYLNIKHMQDIALLTFAILCAWFRMINYPGVIAHGILNMPKL